MVRAQGDGIIDMLLFDYSSMRDEGGPVTKRIQDKLNLSPSSYKEQDRIVISSDISILQAG